MGSLPMGPGEYSEPLSMEIALCSPRSDEEEEEEEEAGPNDDFEEEDGGPSDPATKRARAENDHADKRQRWALHDMCSIESLPWLESGSRLEYANRLEFGSGDGTCEIQIDCTYDRASFSSIHQSN